MKSGEALTDLNARTGLSTPPGRMRDAAAKSCSDRGERDRFPLGQLHVDADVPRLEADQRASQRMAKEQQLSGSEEGKDAKKARPGTNGAPAQAEGKSTLFDRLGGEQGLTAIIEDFTSRALEDPRVNWERKGVKRGGIFGRDDSVADPQAAAKTAAAVKVRPRRNGRLSARVRKANT